MVLATGRLPAPRALGAPRALSGVAGAPRVLFGPAAVTAVLVVLTVVACVTAVGYHRPAPAALLAVAQAARLGLRRGANGGAARRRP